MRKAFLLLTVFWGFTLLPAQGFQPSDSFPPGADTTRFPALFPRDYQNRLRLPNPFLKKIEFGEFGLYKAALQLWLWQNWDQIWQEIKIQNREQKEQFFPRRPSIFWSYSSPELSSPYLDYRESSLYRPENVMDYLQFKMGGDRYIPLVSLAALSYLASQIYRHYGYLLRRREKERYRTLTLDRQELSALKVLWKNPGITAAEWYTRLDSLGENRLTFPQLQKIIARLDEKMLLKTRHKDERTLLYFPAISREDLLFRLRNERQWLDPLKMPRRFEELNWLIKQLEND